MGDQSRVKRSLRDLVESLDWAGVDEGEEGREEERRTRSRSEGRSSGPRQGAVDEEDPLCESDRGIFVICGGREGERMSWRANGVRASWPALVGLGWTQLRWSWGNPRRHSYTALLCGLCSCAGAGVAPPASTSRWPTPTRVFRPSARAPQPSRLAGR